eukprot:m.267315 g.267315  ORF g.267315 m.267315 type:complete len:679 (+) comp19283_c0_seq21:2018-4054(+)
MTRSVGLCYYILTLQTPARTCVACRLPETAAVPFFSIARNIKSHTTDCWTNCIIIIITHTHDMAQPLRSSRRWLGEPCRSHQDVAARRSSSLRNKALIRRLQTAQTLEGHTGCVNSIRWSEDGSTLISGSDDCCVVLWRAPEYQRIAVIRTGHSGNVFCASELPTTDCAQIASCAADGEVRLHNVENPGASRAWFCHRDRTKKLATEPGNPHLFFSSGEDGTVRQMDCRTPHPRCDGTGTPCTSNIVLSLRSPCDSGHAAGCCARGQQGYLGIKCLELCPSRPQYLAVGASDPFVRLFDRRMLARSTTTCCCVQHFDAPSEAPNSWSTASVTSVAFSGTGTDLLASFGNEHAYTYPLLETQPAPRSFCATRNVPRGEPQYARKMAVRKPAWACQPQAAAKLKERGNQKYARKHYAAAVEFYSAALAQDPYHIVALSNRAAALLKRRWPSDLAAVVKDCDGVLAQEPCHAKANFRKLQALHDLGKPKLALDHLATCRPHLMVTPDVARVITAVEQDGLDDQSDDSDDAAGDHGGEQSPVKNTFAEWQQACTPYTNRFVGHVNTVTDIKEACFFGCDTYVMSGRYFFRLHTWRYLAVLGVPCLRLLIALRRRPFVCVGTRDGSPCWHVQSRCTRAQLRAAPSHGNARGHKWDRGRHQALATHGTAGAGAIVASFSGASGS